MPKTIPLEYLETETIAADGKRVITRAKLPKEEPSMADTIVAMAATACVLYAGYRIVKALSTDDTQGDVALVGGDIVVL